MDKPAGPLFPPLLECQAVCAGWQETQVLNKVSLRVGRGETVAVLGRNGVGKTTLLSAVAGRARVHSGRICYDGHDLARSPAFRRARMGVGFVPQEREIFPSLTVQENLLVTANSDLAGLDRIFELFPRLKERRRNFGGHLSGGEQQMLSIARALMLEPKLLLLDEPMEGLAPLLVEQLVQAIRSIQSTEGLSMLLVEQHARIAVLLTDSVVVLDRGAVVYDNVAQGRAADVQEIENHIAVASR